MFHEVCIIHSDESRILIDSSKPYSVNQILNFTDASIKANVTYKIHETLPQYFHGEVLQRNLGSNNTQFGTIKFQVAFNLAVVWMIVFVSLSKGLRSYGKVNQAILTANVVN